VIVVKLNLTEKLSEEDSKNNHLQAKNGLMILPAFALEIVMMLWRAVQKKKLILSSRFVRFAEQIFKIIFKMIGNLQLYSPQSNTL